MAVYHVRLLPNSQRKEVINMLKELLHMLNDFIRKYVTITYSNGIFTLTIDHVAFILNFSTKKCYA